MAKLNRRRFLAAAVGGSIAAAIGRPVAAATATHSMWRLDPAWGYPLTTESGSDTKTRCRSRACHNAAPHRFFLSEADAIAGRLHPCCLAQPVRVEVCADLNELMPYYGARLGGVDARCPTLPAHLRTALQDAGGCAFTPSTEVNPPDPISNPQPPPATAPQPSPATAPLSAPTSAWRAPSSQTASSAVVPAGSASAVQSPPAIAGTLPSTGSPTPKLLGLAAALTAAGTIALAASHTGTTSE